MKGNVDCHIPNDKYREGWDRIFPNKKLRKSECPVPVEDISRKDLDEKNKPVNEITNS